MFIDFNSPVSVLGGLALIGILLGLYVVFWTNPHPGSTNPDSFFNKLCDKFEVIIFPILCIWFFFYRYVLIAVFGIIVGGIGLYSLGMIMFESFTYILIPLYLLLCYFVGRFIGKMIVKSRATRELNTLHSRKIAHDVDKNPMVDEVARKIMNEKPARVDLRRDGIYFYGKDACREWLERYKYSEDQNDRNEYSKERGCYYYEPACYDSIIWVKSGYMNMGFVELHAFTASVGKRIKGYKVINEASSESSGTLPPEDNFVPEGSTIFLQGSIDGDVYSIGPDGYPTSGSLPDYNSDWFNNCQFLSIEFEKMEKEIKAHPRKPQKEESKLKDWQSDNSPRRAGRHPFS